MSGKFEGYYFKHQKDGKTAAFIPGVSSSGAFVQVITNDRSYQFHYPSCTMGERITVGACVFSQEGIKIDLPDIYGEIQYTGITPLKSDIMGFFRFFPMECRHRVVSMSHTLRGRLKINGENVNFDNGIGYIEGDSGRSFPEKYIWLQANDFPDGSSIMLSLAKIPFAGFHFEGCICAIHTGGKEYRLATYCGVKTSILMNHIILKQNKLRLEIAVLSPGTGHPLSSPHSGNMSGIIHEHNNARVRIKLFSEEHLLSDLYTEHAGYENFGYLL